jgi:DNA-binding NarL/FixJ family response regulator
VSGAAADPEDDLTTTEPLPHEQIETPGRPADAMIPVLIVDRHQSVGEALEARLSAEPDLEIVGLAQTRDRAEEMTRSRHPTLAVVNTGSDPAWGVELVTTIRRADRRLRVVAITDQTDGEWIVPLVRAGAAGLVLAESTMAEFLSTVRGVARGESHIPPALLTPVLLSLQQSTPAPNDAQRRLSRLSPREEEVLALMVNGLDRHAVADELCLSVNTVRTHVKNILSKLDVHSSLEAVSVALQAGERPGSTASVQA